MRLFGGREFEPINCISVISHGENLSDVLTIPDTISVRERAKLVCQGTTVYIY